ncbi:hypothetical protein IFVP136_C1180037 [Vibrio parahaemolyticus]
MSRARVLFVLRDIYTSRFGKACKSVVSEMPEIKIKKSRSRSHDVGVAKRLFLKS